MNRLQELKNDFSVVEEINLYNTVSCELILSESPASELDFIEELDQGKNFEDLNFMFLGVESGSFLILNGTEKLVLIIKIKGLTNFNKPILLARAKSMLHDLEKKI